jgi:hypothetical protein
MASSFDFPLSTPNMSSGALIHHSFNEPQRGGFKIPNSVIRENYIQSGGYVTCCHGFEVLRTLNAFVAHFSFVYFSKFPSPPKGGGSPRKTCFISRSKGVCFILFLDLSLLNLLIYLFIHLFVGYIS